MNKLGEPIFFPIPVIQRNYLIQMKQELRLEIYKEFNDRLLSLEEEIITLRKLFIEIKKEQEWEKIG